MKIIVYIEKLESCLLKHNSYLFIFSVLEYKFPRCTMIAILKCVKGCQKKNKTNRCRVGVASF